MARGRIIVSDITRDKRINNLSCDTSRLAFTWLITFADRAGRTYGDPALVKSMLFPRRTDITTEHVAGFLREWHDCGLAIWYEGDDDLWVQFPSFLKHQKGFDRRHEPDSVIPDPPATPDIANVDCTDNVQARYVQSTAEVEVEVEVEVEGKGKTPARQFKDPVLDILERKAERDKTGDLSGIAEPTAKDLYAHHRDDASRIYEELTGKTMNRAQHDVVVDLAAGAGFDIDKWRSSVQSVLASGVRDGNVACMVDTYQAGGDYRKMVRKDKDNGHNRKSTSTATFFGNCPRPEWRDADPALFAAGGDSEGA